MEGKVGKKLESGKASCPTFGCIEGTEERVAAPSADDILDDLAFLRKGQGFTPARLASMGGVVELLRAHPDEPFERMRSRFESAIHSLGQPQSDLLLDIFALSPHTRDLPRLGDRRQAYATQIGRGVETVANREVSALQRLVSTLVRGTFAQSPLTIAVPEMHGGIIYETTSTLIVVENRKWARTLEHYRFVATFDEMDFLTITRSYEAKTTADPKGRFRVNTRPTSHGFNDHFWHQNVARDADEPMRRGEMYDLKFLLEPIDRDQLGPMVNAYRAFHERSLLASIRVAFVGERPSQVWKYERVSHFDQPGVPTDHNRVLLDESATATLRLRDLHGGLVSGIAWVWGD